MYLRYIFSVSLLFMERMAAYTSAGTGGAHPETSIERKAGRKERLFSVMPWLIPVSALAVIVYRLRSLTPNVLREVLGGMAAVFFALGCLAVLLLGVKRGLMGND